MGHATRAESPDRGRGVILRRSIMIAGLTLLATPAAAGWTLACVFGGCSITFVSPEYAAKPVQPLDPEAGLAQINAYRTKNGRKPVVLSRAAAAQSKAQAGRSRIGHDGSDGSKARAPVIVRRSPGRMSPPGRNRSATSCAAGKEARAIGRTCCFLR